MIGSIQQKLQVGKWHLAHLDITWTKEMLKHICITQGAGVAQIAATFVACLTVHQAAHLERDMGVEKVLCTHGNYLHAFLHCRHSSHC